MIHRVAAALTVAAGAARRRLTEAAQHPDRGDVSITTVIIWVAAISGAIAIAGTITALLSRYNGKLSDI
ncbi:hypothetical protein [Streptomyces megasporus]|uniref:hypothetical protein n=1 Tax=Streptomyces megasporus TaxID=44060 RepID=UPI0004E27552|nr:hypothetical protein [Streptomyces megasporus]